MLELEHCVMSLMMAATGTTVEGIPNQSDVDAEGSKLQILVSLRVFRNKSHYFSP